VDPSNPLTERWGPSPVAAITGAASGLGWALANAWARQGGRLAVADVRGPALDTVVQQWRGQGVEVLSTVVDVAQPHAVQAWADHTVSTWGAPHLVFNNAGIATGGLVWETTPAEWQHLLGVNLMGVVHGVHAFVPHLLRRAQQQPGFRSTVVNTASMAGLVNLPNMGAYNASKHAVVALSETLHHDLSLVTDQVKAAVLCPFFVPTGIAEHVQWPQQPTASQRHAQQALSKAVTSGRVSADEVARLVLEAVVQDRFYIYSHPQALGGVQARMEDLLTGVAPRDPYAAKPEWRQALKASVNP